MKKNAASLCTKLWQEQNGKSVKEVEMLKGRQGQSGPVTQGDATVNPYETKKEVEDREVGPVLPQHEPPVEADRVLHGHMQTNTNS